MSQSEVARFIADLKSNADLQAEAKKLQLDKTQAMAGDAITSFATSKGYDFTTEDMKQLVAARALSDAELDQVVGAGSPHEGQGHKGSEAGSNEVLHPRGLPTP